MGEDVLILINTKLLPHVHSMFSLWLMIIGTIQIIYVASTTLGQQNSRKRIAYSSVSHMEIIII
uniref:NADH:quinone oxidoreductase/Mrp antiporter transmembrane domain-containing protein n=1 Tax=Solanum lycopersicum TaxID=4081 RepID=A0A3Q7EVA1_SOLLC